MNFMPDPLLKEGIENNNLRHIRSAISSYMVNDPSNSRGEIIPAVNYVEKEKGITDLWQPHDGRTFKPIEDWDEDYFGLLQAQLMNNFSKERFNHALKVGKKVYGRPSSSSRPKQSVEAKTVYLNRSNQNTREQNAQLGKFLPVFLGVGIVVVILMILFNRK